MGLKMLGQNKLMLCLISYMVGYFSGTVNNKAVTFFNSNTPKGEGGEHDGGVITTIVEDDNKNKKKTNGLILPFERTELKVYLEKGKKMTDTYTYFHHYMRLFGAEQPDSPKDFETLPLLHIWPIYFEAYHNHWQRHRGKEVVFMEIGVQSGGKIPLLRDYFGKGLTYVGVDINKSTKKFESADWIHIEIGSSDDPEFLAKLREKYPKVDLFLDDGGHTMNQQRVAMKEMLPHIQPDGVYMCEDLSTSWSEKFSGSKFKDSRDSEFLEKTMVGLVHRSMDWLQAGWIPGKVMWEDNMESEEMRNFFGPNESWWLEFHRTVRHIHYYNQLVVYEKGYREPVFPVKTIGDKIPYKDSGEHAKVDWGPILDRVSNYTNSEWFEK
ncbi:hypothetical protein ACHAXM_010927 [Skeletonema potamos]